MSGIQFQGDGYASCEGTLSFGFIRLNEAFIGTKDPMSMYRMG